MELHKLSKYIKFEVVRINRESINFHPENPRVIDTEARKWLKENIETKGFLETIVVNRRTMNLVSGHQRISILDSLEKSKNYSIDVAMVDLDEKAELEQLIFFNSLNAQGKYDHDKLTNIFTDASFDYHAAGVKDNEYAFLTAGLKVSAMESKEIYDMLDDYDQQIKQEKKALRESPEYQEKKAAAVALENAIESQNEPPAYLTISFTDFAAKQAFCEKIGVDIYSKVIKGEWLSDNFIK